MARPKKNVTVNEEVKTEAVEEKKSTRRGRPKKNSAAAEEMPEAVKETAKETVTEAPVSDTEEKKEPAKRGRKKKTETVEAEKKEPAKRGRRKKTETEKEAEEIKEETVETKENNTVMEITTIVQYKGNEIEQREMIAKVEEAWRAEGNTAPIEAIKMYVKPEDGKIYYVVNGLAGSCDLF